MLDVFIIKGGGDRMTFQGDLRALGHPQRPRQAQPRRVQQVPVMFIKMDELDEVAEGVREPLDQPLINSI